MRRARVRVLSAVEGLQHGAAVLRRYRGVADACGCSSASISRPWRRRACRPSSHCRGRAARLRRSRSLCRRSRQARGADGAAAGRRPICRSARSLSRPITISARATAGDAEAAERLGRSCRRSSRCRPARISIVDGEGNAVSFTTTIEGPFGSRLFVDGFLLNNELTDFSRSPERDGQPVANRVRAWQAAAQLDGAHHGVRPAGAVSCWWSARPAVPRSSPVRGEDVDRGARLGPDPQAAADLPNFGNRNGATELRRARP